MAAAPPVVGPWINTSASTYNFTAKSVVAGSVAWPTAAYTIALNPTGTLRNVTTNDLPNHNTGNLPHRRYRPSPRIRSEPQPHRGA